MEAEQERKDRLESERKKRFELETILLKWLGVSNVLEIPEVKIDAQKERGERIFSIKPSRRFNEIPNRLIAEVAIYYKFIKNKRRGYVFTYAGDIEPFLVKWGYFSHENRQYVAAQIANDFLSRLRTVELLHKAPGSIEWRVIKNTFT